MNLHYCDTCSLHVFNRVHPFQAQWLLYVCAICLKMINVSSSFTRFFYDFRSKSCLFICQYLIVLLNNGNTLWGKNLILKCFLKDLPAPKCCDLFWHRAPQDRRRATRLACAENDAVGLHRLHPGWIPDAAWREWPHLQHHRDRLVGVFDG